MLNILFYFILLKKFRVTKPDILYVIMQDNIYIYIYIYIYLFIYIYIYLFVLYIVSGD